MLFRSEQYRKLRNTLRYMAGNVHDVPRDDGSDAWAEAWDCSNAKRYASLPALDKWRRGRRRRRRPWLWRRAS